MTGYWAIVALAAIEGGVRVYRIHAENQLAAVSHRRQGTEGRIVSAASKREELEAAIRRTVANNRKCTAKGSCTGCEGNIAETLDRADELADAVAEQRVARMTPEQWRARLRLAEATAEADGRPA